MSRHDEPDPLALLRDLVDALPRCDGLAARGGRCPRAATREYENAPGWTPACDDPGHVPGGPTWTPRVRPLRYADTLRAALDALARKSVEADDE